MIAVLLLASCASVRILTYNIHAGKDATGAANLQRVASIVRSTTADIVLLQEVDRNTQRSGDVDQVAELARLTGMRAEFGKSLDYQGGEYGIAILSRWPIVAHETIPLHIEPPQVRAGGSTEPRVALLVTVQSPRGELRIVNTHLDASREDGYRMQEVPQVLAAAHDAIAGGDFNAEPDSRVHDAVMRAGMRDAVAPMRSRTAAHVSGIRSEEADRLRLSTRAMQVGDGDRHRCVGSPAAAGDRAVTPPRHRRSARRQQRCAWYIFDREDMPWRTLTRSESAR